MNSGVVHTGEVGRLYCGVLLTGEVGIGYTVMNSGGAYMRSGYMLYCNEQWWCLQEKWVGYTVMNSGVVLYIYYTVLYHLHLFKQWHQELQL